MYIIMSYRGGGMGSFWVSPATSNATTEFLTGRYVDGTKVGGSMADIHYHLAHTNTYDRRPNLKKYNERPPNHKAHQLILENHFDYEKKGGSFTQDHTGESGFSEMMNKQKMGASKDIMDVAGKAAQVIGTLI